VRALDARARWMLEGNTAEVRAVARQALAASANDEELRLLLVKMEAASGDYESARASAPASS